MEGLSMAIPNQDLIQYLVESYYGEDASYQESGLYSSYWRIHTEKAQVRLDSDGQLATCLGASFGVTKWNNVIHRVLEQLCILTHLTHLPHRRELLGIMSLANKVCKRMGLDPTMDVFRQVCSLELITRHMGEKWTVGRPTFLVIGDGYGVLSALFKAVFPNSTSILVDLGRTLLFQSFHCQSAYPELIHKLASEVEDPYSTDFVYCPAEELEALERFDIDIAVNIASMQEMNEATIAQYFALLRRRMKPDNFFYCCNRESKVLYGGELIEFLKYPWHEKDRYLVDEYCPWHQYFFAYRPTEKGLRIFGLRVPFVNYYDGKHLHRLTILSTEA
jgi:hypothetical protein